MPKTARTRFAPSPTGYLHLGNARAALFSWLAAQNGGEMLLRMEDTDGGRGEERHIAAIAEDLAWLGLTWTGGARRQSESAARHAESLQNLLRQKHAYYCFCPPEKLRAEREEQLRAGLPPRYSGRCAALSETETAARRNAGEAAAVRFRMPPENIVFDDAVRGKMQFSGADIGDFILRRTAENAENAENSGISENPPRANGGFSFFFANAVDDSADGITLVLRGEDHLSNTPRQLAILAALGMRAPKYGHLPLLTAPGGGPLSKRESAASLRGLRKSGFLPEALINYLARAGCTLNNENLLSKTELAAAFSPAAVSKSPSAFDMGALIHWQKKAARNMSPAEYEKWMSRAFTDSENAKKPREFAAFCAAVRENITLSEDAHKWAEIITNDLPPQTEAAAAAIQTAGADFYKAAAAAVMDDMEWKFFCEKVGAATGCKGKNLFMPLRAALTGLTGGPEMPPLYKLIGAKKARRRLESAV